MLLLQALSLLEGDEETINWGKKQQKSRYQTVVYDHSSQPLTIQLRQILKAKQSPLVSSCLEGSKTSAGGGPGHQNKRCGLEREAGSYSPAVVRQKQTIVGVCHLLFHWQISKGQLPRPKLTSHPCSQLYPKMEEKKKARLPWS